MLECLLYAQPLGWCWVAQCWLGFVEGGGLKHVVPLHLSPSRLRWKCSLFLPLV